MKRILALLMAVLMCLSIFSLAACKKNDKEDSLSGAQRYKEKYDFEAFIEDNADIIGSWTKQLDADSKSSKCAWTFNEDTTIKIVETLKDQGVQVTTDGACNYNEKTGEISYMLVLNKADENGKPVSDIKEFDAKVTIEGNKMTFTYADGTKDIFTK